MNCSQEEVVHTINPRTREAEQVDLCEFKGYKDQKKKSFYTLWKLRKSPINNIKTVNWTNEV